MSALPDSKRWTAEEYLAFERESDDKHEFIDGEIYLMSGGSENHAYIMLNTGWTLKNQLRGTQCRAAVADLRVRAGGSYTYPDVVVVCGKSELKDGLHDTLLNPTLIVEVLSPSTERYDRGAKFQHYSDIASLQEYVLISQETYRVERFLRDTNGEWRFIRIEGLDSAIELPSIGCTLALTDIYDNINLENSGSTSNA